MCNTNESSILGEFVLTTQDLLMKKAVVWYEGETTPGMKKRKKKFGAQGFTCDSKSSQVFNIFPRQESSTSRNELKSDSDFLQY